MSPKDTPRLLFLLLIAISNGPKIVIEALHIEATGGCFAWLCCMIEVDGLPILISNKGNLFLFVFRILEESKRI